MKSKMSALAQTMTVSSFLLITAKIKAKNIVRPDVAILLKFDDTEKGIETK
jgi:hypothetical protein